MKKRIKIDLSKKQAIVSFYDDEALVVGALAKKDDDNPTASTLYHMAVAADEQQAHIEHLKARIEKLEKITRIGNHILHDTVVGMKSAVIDAEHHGAERGMAWIKNKLRGPGMLPDKDDPHYHDAQAFYDYYCHDAEMARQEAK